MFFYGWAFEHDWFTPPGTGPARTSDLSAGVNQNLVQIQTELNQGIGSPPRIPGSNPFCHRHMPLQDSTIVPNALNHRGPFEPVEPGDWFNFGSVDRFLDQFGSILARFGSILAQFGPFWLSLVQFWLSLVHFGSVWLNFGSVWSILAQFGSILAHLPRFGSVLAQSGSVWLGFVCRFF